MLKCTSRLSQCEWLSVCLGYSDLGQPSLLTALSNHERPCAFCTDHPPPAQVCLHVPLPLPSDSSYSLLTSLSPLAFRSQLKGPLSYCTTQLCLAMCTYNLLQIFLPKIERTISWTQVRNTRAGDNKYRRKFQMSTV